LRYARGCSEARAYDMTQRALKEGARSPHSRPTLLGPVLQLRDPLFTWPLQRTDWTTVAEVDQQHRIAACTRSVQWQASWTSDVGALCQTPLGRAANPPIGP
jgi:hypothetical protein